MEHKYKIGDYARIVGNDKVGQLCPHHYYEMGEIVKIVKIGKSLARVINYAGLTQTVRVRHIKPIKEKIQNF